MEAEDIIQLPSCGDFDNGNHEEGADKLGIEDNEVGTLDEEIMEEIEEGHLISKTKKVRGGLVETTETSISGYVALHSENDDSLVEEGQLVSDMVTNENAAVLMENVAEVDRKDIVTPCENGGVIECEKPDIGSTSGVKRLRMTVDEQHPSVIVKYYSLSRRSKQKLEELLREWIKVEDQRLGKEYTFQL
ncbi:Mitochondrial fission protein ELM1 [Bienertia sinuspersici]